MRISMEWLSQYVDLTGITPEALGDALTNSGLEVEAIEHLGGQFSGVVVAQVLAVDPHPNADRLRLVTVDRGPVLGVIQVVCGAPNVEEGMMIAFANVGGQVINRKEGGLFTLTPAKIRGVLSEGMVCSIEELGLQETFPANGEGGIWPIGAFVGPEDKGKDLKEALNLEDDIVLDLAPTANRGDLMSYIGVAREVAAIFDREVLYPKIPVQQPETRSPLGMKIQLKDVGVCHYYGAVLLENIKIAPSPDWMVRRLQSAGIRSISNVVDITNYVMMELGQPLHAFDYAKLPPSGEIGVRFARMGETLRTLDAVDRTLSDDSVVITINDQPVALAGLMGGESTEVSNDTTSVLLESAYFPPPTNRRSARSVGLRTEANARFERGVDIGMCQKALARATVLMEELCQAKYTVLIESPMPEPSIQPISLRHSRLEQIIGLQLDVKLVITLLTKLGFQVDMVPETLVYKVIVPTHRRNDVKKEIDLIEEVIRIYGYDKIPYTLPQKTNAVSHSARQRLLHLVRYTLGGLGLQEVVTTSLVGESVLTQPEFGQNPDSAVTLSNSHSKDHMVMRQTLIPSLLEIVQDNLAQGKENVWIYETGRTYFKRPKGVPSEQETTVQEMLMLGGALVGVPTKGQWDGTEKIDFFTLKGVIEGLLEALPLSSPPVFLAEKNIPFLHPGRTAKIRLQGTVIGVLGELHPAAAHQYKFREPVYVFELNFEKLAQICFPKSDTGKEGVKSLPKPVSISQYPSVKRDMAFSAPDTLSHQEIIDALQKVSDPLVSQIELFDEYRGAQVAQGQRSLAYRVTLQSMEQTLTDAQIDATMEKLKKQLASAFPVQFR